MAHNLLYGLGNDEGKAITVIWPSIGGFLIGDERLLYFLWKDYRSSRDEISCWILFIWRIVV